MDWQLVITRNRDALLPIIVALIKLLGLANGGMLTTLPRFLFARALRILRPAESALRRLIFIAAHDLALSGYTLPQPRMTHPNFALFNRSPVYAACAFSLIDPLKRFDQDLPAFSTFCDYQSSGRDASNSHPILAVALGRRLLALKLALENIPGQAKRLARWNALRDEAIKRNQPHRLSPLRPGLPLGLSQRNTNEAGEILRECHRLAIYARDRCDSS